MDVLDVVMWFDGEGLFVGGQSTEALSEDHFPARLVFNGEVIF